MSDEELECLRKKAGKRYLITFALCGGLFLATMAYMVWGGIHSDGHSVMDWLIFPLFLSGLLTAAVFVCCYFLLIRRPYEAFNKAYKERYVLSVIWGTGLFDGLEYAPKGGFTFQELGDAAIMECGVEHHYLSEDLLTGYYRGVRFRYCDVTTGRGVKTGKAAEVKKIFTGQVMELDAFESAGSGGDRLQIFEREIILSFKGCAAPYKIETDDAAFNRRFQVYASDKRDALRLLTPGMTGNILAFADAVGKRISISVQGPKMFVAVHRVRSLFDVYVDKTVYEQKAEILEDIKPLQAAVDLLLGNRAR